MVLFLLFQKTYFPCRFILNNGKNMAQHAAVTRVLFSGLEHTVQCFSPICGFTAYLQKLCLSKLLTVSCLGFFKPIEDPVEGQSSIANVAELPARIASSNWRIGEKLLEFEHSGLIGAQVSSSLATLLEFSWQLPVVFSHLGPFSPVTRGSRRVTTVGSGAGGEEFAIGVSFDRLL
eukprot:IDg7759t1